MRFAIMELIRTPTMETQPVISATIMTASSLEASEASHSAATVIEDFVAWRNQHIIAPKIATKKSKRSSPSKKFNLGCLAENGMLFSVGFCFIFHSYHPFFNFIIISRFKSKVTCLHIKIWFYFTSEVYRFCIRLSRERYPKK